ncbi:MAG: hypothetical protein IPK77_11810 [Cellvibrio sp.]|nr:hypothetical protein [Cellvibrio sp.]
MSDDFEFWMKLVKDSEKQMEITQNILSNNFGLGRQERYELNYENGFITFYTGQVPTVTAKFTILGSVSFAEGTWLWSWANPHINETVKSEMAIVKEFGVKQGVSALTNSQFNADQNDGWLMAAISSFILKSEGVWLTPFQGGVTYVALKEVTKA